MLITRVNADGSHIQIHTFSKDDDGQWVDWERIYEGNFGDCLQGKFIRLQIHKGIPGEEHKGELTLEVIGKIVSNT